VIRLLDKVLEYKSAWLERSRDEVDDASEAVGNSHCIDLKFLFYAIKHNLAPALKSWHF